jgi:hypothetical protein
MGLINHCRLLKLFQIPFANYILLALVNLLCVMLVFSYQQPFELDGIKYLHAAEVFIQQGFTATFHSHEWPLYSILIGLLAKYFPLSLVGSAHLLDALFDFMTVFVFFHLIADMGGKRRIQWIGALLLMTLPYFNHFRDDILRDHGYFAFSLLAMWFLIRYARDMEWKHAIGWAGAMLVATLFRVEGIILLLFLPLIFFFRPNFNWVKKIKLILKAYTLHIMTFLGFLGLLGWSLMTHQVAVLWNTYFYRLVQLRYAVDFQNLFFTFHEKTNLIRTNIITSDSADKAIYVVIFGLIAVYFTTLLYTLEIPNAVLILYTWIKKKIMSDWASQIVWKSFVWLNVLITVVFVCQGFFLTSRYMGLLSILLLMCAPFAIEHIYQNFQQAPQRFKGSQFWIFVLLVMGLLYMIVAGVGHFGQDKRYQIQVGQWIQAHIDPKVEMCFDNLQVAYYAGRAQGCVWHENRTQIYQVLSQKNIPYVAFKFSRHDLSVPSIIQQYHWKIEQVFKNRRGDQVILFSLHQT